MNTTYKNRIAESKARLDTEMRDYAATLYEDYSFLTQVALLRTKFPAITEAYARELARDKSL